MKIIFSIFFIIWTGFIAYGNDKKSLIDKQIIHSSKFFRFLDISFEEAIKQAQKEKKLIMMFIHEDGGPWCEKMRVGTFKNKEIISILNENYISIQFDKYEDEIDIPMKLIPGFIPTIYIIDPKTSKVMIEITGYTEAMSLYDKLEESIEFYGE